MFLEQELNFNKELYKDAINPMNSIEKNDELFSVGFQLSSLYYDCGRF